jgi:uncharacterized damage-inducible protein DinB
MDALWFRSQLEYHYWANGRLLDAMADLTPEQYTRDLGGSFPSIQATVAHLLNAETVWLNRLLGENRPGVGPDSVPTVAAARERWNQLKGTYLSLLEQIGDAGLTVSLQAKTSSGQVYSHPRWEVLQHLVNHGTYHRGQIALMMRQVGVAPASTDLILFYRVRSGQTE